MKTASAKAKGRRLQQWVCRQIAKVTGMEQGKDCPIESRPMGQSGVDVRLEKAALKKFPFSVECKNQQSWSVHQWIEQAKSNCLPNTDWLIVAKRNRAKEVVIMDARAFFRLIRKVNLRRTK